MNAYRAWKKKNSIVQITLLSNMKNDIVCKYEHYRMVSKMCLALKKEFGGTSTTKLLTACDQVSHV